MTQWLLKNEGYPPAVVVSVLLHGLLLVLIFVWNRDHKELLRIEQPAAIVATTARENPQRVRAQEQKRKQQQKESQEREKVKEQERQHQEILVKEEAERLKSDQQRKVQDQDQKRKQEEQRLQAQREQDKKQDKEKQDKDKEKQQQAVKEQAQREVDLAKQQAAMQRALTEEQQLVAAYQEKIRVLIESNWSRPGGTRRETVALVELQMTPAGDVINYTIIQSSGDANFDDSVRRAVGKAGRFSFLIDLNPGIFNRYFRKFSLEFKPGDLPL